MFPRPLELRSVDDFPFTENISWWDADSECTTVVTRPDIDRELWEEYLRGAERSYRNHGVECALDVDAIRDGSDTALFWATIDTAGRMIGGVRAKGPLTCADDSHATVEWTGQPGLHAVRKMIDDRVPFGVLEMKAAWISDDRETARRLSKALARSGFHAMAIMGIQFCMATSAPYILESWRTSGGVVAPIAATPYPDERYRTKMMWWDRRTFANHADPEQVSKILSEMATVSAQLDPTASQAMAR
ncbi:hypothetical protein [Mycolicibacterium sp. 050158]|uniref:hypothetical protein n=1 Tax=Mycolicibacterium sp. 050158 TaxID=3090602 RepID=UPI00299EBF14|nr:hypothetical protein [Mycolicibacterium sp. 050158]MDX1888991.1 hypothetical protein [Mycolicibacterium sp. 050158]